MYRLYKHWFQAARLRANFFEAAEAGCSKPDKHPIRTARYHRESAGSNLQCSGELEGRPVIAQIAISRPLTETSPGQMNFNALIYMTKIALLHTIELCQLTSIREIQGSSSRNETHTGFHGPKPVLDERPEGFGKHKETRTYK